MCDFTYKLVILHNKSGKLGITNYMLITSEKAIASSKIQHFGNWTSSNITNAFSSGATNTSADPVPRAGGHTLTLMH